MWNTSNMSIYSVEVVFQTILFLIAFLHMIDQFVNEAARINFFL